MYLRRRGRVSFLIDDLFLIWEGAENSLHEFLTELNTNENNIKLECQWSKEQIQYLDVSVFRQGDYLGAKVYFRPKDRNSYLPLQSRHHPL